MSTPEITKPDWLKALEAQSWQAELIASGLAIYGSISLGAYIDDIAQWTLTRFSDRTLTILYFAFIYIYAAHALLVVSFISHLGLRILWAGILGLSSVYPKGINVESTAYSESYKKQLKRDFPDLSAYSLSLDRLCSLIFSILCALVIILTSITIWILAFLLISELLANFLPYRIIDQFGLILLGIFLLSSALGTLLTQTKLKDSKLGDRFGYSLTMAYAKITYLLGFKAFIYITQTIRTNVTSKLFFLGMAGIMFLSMFLALPRFFPLVPYFQSNIWPNYRIHSSQVEGEHYLDAFKTTIILEPVIQSKIITDNYLNLFIPKFARENKQRIALCGEYDWKDDISRFENRAFRSLFRASCANQYYQIMLDSIPLSDLDFQQKKHTHRSEIGYQVYIPIDSLSRGRHLLQIQSAYQNEDEENFRRTIPFYKP